MEYYLKPDETNLKPEIADSLAKRKLFDWMLYLNVPIVYFVCILFLYTVSSQALHTYELVGLILSTAIVLASNGINVAHELGHRKEWSHQVMSRLLLLPSMYCHFTIEHNHGHHKNVATPLDPASANKNELLYLFWFRSLAGTYRNAWAIETKRLRKNNQLVISFRNQTLIGLLLQTLLILVIFLSFGIYPLIAFLIVSFVSVLFLETINYIEHYGLKRAYVNGRYERVNPMHSWNSNHDIGRILLYELTRHSDHHYIANKKYQILDHHDEARQLPLGYPGSMLLAMVPPLWFRIMNNRI
jgi:alkane 1-monooxygenase